MPNYRYNTPDYMRQNNSNGCHVGGEPNNAGFCIAIHSFQIVLQYS